MNKIHLITDLQYGSTGKGLFAGFLAIKEEPDTVVAAWGPNAGHTFIDDDGSKMVNIALPNGIISSKLRRVLIGPGSVINPQLLMSELEQYAPFLDSANGVSVAIHECAAVVQERHREAEAQYGAKIGSTLKGVGQAQMEKIKRDPNDIIIARDALRGTPLEGNLVTDAIYADMIDSSRCVLVEGAQGYSLSLNHGWYPYVTSRNCTTAQIMSDCGIPYDLHRQVEVYGVCRTYPIRVNNRGNYSGPCYPDQDEIPWSAIGQEPELTTVTKLPRRLFTFSMQQIREACRMNGINQIFLNFCNYLAPMGISDDEKHERVDHLVGKIETVAPVYWLGWGPRVGNIQPA